jgi:putative membrane protein
MAPGPPGTTGGDPRDADGAAAPLAGSILEQPEKLRAALKTLSSTDLAETRTALAAERTLMAWIRTALAMISFGFSIFKFIHMLNRSDELAPHRLGMLLAALGTFSLMAGTVQYARQIRSLQGRRIGFTFYVACAVIAIGVLVLAGIVFRLGPLR